MDKLSSILGSSPRVKSVDLSDAHPVRPGTPSFGRPVGTTSIRDRFTVSDSAKDRALQDTVGFRNQKEDRQTKIAENVTKKFFETRLQPKEEVLTGLPLETVSVGSPAQALPESAPQLGDSEPSDMSTESLEHFLQE
jgi:hypothetical protein